MAVKLQIKENFDNKGQLIKNVDNLIHLKTKITKEIHEFSQK